MVDLKSIDKKWQSEWEKSGIFKVTEDPQKPKFFALEMYPYPSGAGLHMGHVRNYAIGDSFARFKRMTGFNVLYPMGYDAFGLPAENAAIKRGVDPAEWTYNNIETMKGQQKALGLSYDWDRQVASCDQEYYKWNQWIFLKMLEKGIAYRKSSLVNWCPDCNTVLANEQVEDGKCWRCKHEVEHKDLEQWFLKIKDYADRLLEDSEKLENWPERVKIMQKNWIGKSHGTEIFFQVKDIDLTISTFTTRPDTVYGITYLVFAPEHPIVQQLIKGTKHEESVKEFIKKVSKQSTIERTAEGKEKHGVFTGRYFINPVNGEEFPIWIADYAIMDYGTGAVMAVPTHDQRDFEFAKKYDLPLKLVIKPDSHDINVEKMARAYVEDGVLVNSGDFDGTNNREAIEEISKFLEKNKWGKRTINYKLRDWLISRQRYWGTPIPIVYCKECGAVPVPEDQLPVLLPKNVKFTGEGNPLETCKEFVQTKCPKCDKPATRETDTMDTFIDSSWYFLRYCSPHEDRLPFNKEAAKYWMPVDQYIGGIEHAILHLLYARFFTKFIKDIGLIDFDEPFKRLLCQGMVIKEGAKMSKSLGNTVDPMEIIGKYGADTARVFILFTALPEKELDWNDEGVAATFRFLNRVFRLVEDDIEAPKTKELSNRDKHMVGKMHRTIKKVTDLINEFKLSLALGSLMDYTNALYKYQDGQINKQVYDDAVKSLILLLSPFAPHMCEEMWEMIGEKGFISQAEWPKYDKDQIDEKAEAAENMIGTTIADISAVLGLTKTEKPKKITLFVSDQWKYDFLNTLKQTLEETRNAGEIIKKLMSTDLKKYGQAITKLVPKFVKDPSKMPVLISDNKTEFDALTEAKESITEEFSCELEIINESDSKENKAKHAMPSKPAILVE